MAGYYTFNTRAGAFHIVPERNGRWQAMFKDESLGSYTTAQHALDDLAGGHTFWPSCGDPSQFALPGEISGWKFVSMRR